MTEKVENPSRTRLDFLRQIKGLRILATLAMLVALVTVLGMSSRVQTSSALVKNAENAALPQPQETPPACATIPQEDCVPNPNGEGTICCGTDSVTGDRTCRMQSESCETFDNPCDPDHPVLAFVTTTLVTHSHTDAHGGRHFRTHLEIHGTTPIPGQCTDSTGVGSLNKGIGGNGFAFVKTSTSQGFDVINVVKNSGFNSSGPPPETFSDPLNIHIITKGSSPNFTLHLTLHMTENKNGEVTACISHENTSCENLTQPQ